MTSYSETGDKDKMLNLAEVLIPVPASTVLLTDILLCLEMQGFQKSEEARVGRNLTFFGYIYIGPNSPNKCQI